MGLEPRAATLIPSHVRHGMKGPRPNSSVFCSFCLASLYNVNVPLHLSRTRSSVLVSIHAFVNFLDKIKSLLYNVLYVLSLHLSNTRSSVLAVRQPFSDCIFLGMNDPRSLSLKPGETKISQCEVHASVCAHSVTSSRTNKSWRRTSSCRGSRRSPKDRKRE